jgi:hypothetical protein
MDPQRHRTSTPYPSHYTDSAGGPCTFHGTVLYSRGQTEVTHVKMISIACKPAEIRTVLLPDVNQARYRCAILLNRTCIMVSNTRQNHKFLKKSQQIMPKSYGVTESWRVLIVNVIIKLSEQIRMRFFFYWQLLLSHDACVRRLYSCNWPTVQKFYEVQTVTRKLVRRKWGETHEQGPNPTGGVNPRVCPKGKGWSAISDSSVQLTAMVTIRVDDHSIRARHRSTYLQV